ncbi:dnd_rel_methyl, DNA phosphorothioation-associated putative methyltransferase [Acidimicrobiia bacterium]
MGLKIARHKTAMSRNFLSRPLQQAFADGIFAAGTSFFDYGCGRGTDIKHVAQLGHPAAGWDPAHAKSAKLVPSSVVNIGFVVNVIEDKQERASALRKAWELASDVLIVAARLDWEPSARTGRPYGDGILTASGTFQKYFSQQELRTWIDSTLGEKAIAAAPGIFYVFRSSDAEQRLLSRHSRDHRAPQLSVAELIYNQQSALLEPLGCWIRANSQLPTAPEIENADLIIETFGSIRSAFSLIRRVSEPGQWDGVDLGNKRVSEDRFEKNLIILQPLLDFLSDRGRPPRDEELVSGDAIIESLGSIRAAVSLIRKVVGNSYWAEHETRARDDFLVYLALAAFNGRPKFRDLPEELQYDARDFFGSYREACDAADELLFGVGNLEMVNAACRDSPVGKSTPEALYVHVQGTNKLPPLLRVYIGCAEMLTGSVSNATLLKIHREKPQVSFLSYPMFDSDPHPALAASVIARLRELRVDYRDYSERENPPVLHRKETFVPSDYSGREKFARLTRQEENHGLLNSNTIGTQNGWHQALAESGFETRGHRLVRVK